ncbi:MAG: hypothetical protein ACRECE_03280, partial [Xanthobacteraceae bacterium]
GLYNAYTDGGRPELAVAHLGDRWELEQIALRLWPSASLIQGMTTALFDLIDKHGVDFARVRKVRIALSPGAHKMHGCFGTYKAKFEALLSAHYTAAVFLHDRELTLAQFEPVRYDDPTLRRFAAEQVEVRPEASIDGSQAIVDIDTVDGATFSAGCEHPLGSAENPLSREQIEQKFRSYAKGVLPDTVISEVIDAVKQLEDLPSTRRLMEMLRIAPRPASQAMVAAE